MDFFQKIDTTILPKKISNKNILSAIIEIKFSSNMPQEVIIGSLYSSSAIREHYRDPKATGVNQIPQHIRAKDQNLKHAILFNLDSKDDKFRIGCGNNIISLANINFAYNTWKDFIEEFQRILNIMNIFLTNKEVIGVRYINAFPNNILDHFNMTLQVLDQNVSGNFINFLFESQIDDRLVRSIITNKANYSFFDIDNNKTQLVDNATVFDIDVILHDKNKIGADLIKEISLSHNIVKKVFFGILKPEFVKNTLKPEDEA